MPAKKYFTQADRAEARRQQTRALRQRMGREAFLEMCRDSAHRAKYGISLVEREKLLWKQAGLCNICCKPMGAGRGPDGAHLDHDHETGRIRGLICANCNMGIGQLKHDPLLLEGAATYLRVA